MTANGHPVLRIVKGEPDAEELAAVVAVLGALSARDPAGGQQGAVVASWTRLGPYVAAPGDWLSPEDYSIS